VRTRIKICGITRWEDAAAAVECGADALGFVFVPNSPRCIGAKQAATIIQRLPPFVSAVGLFMNQQERDIGPIIDQVPLDILQFHGNESAQECACYQRHYIKALPMGGNIDPADYMAGHPLAKGFLLDSHADGGLGGSGHTFDWNRIPRGLDIPIILAGGLKPENVAAAIGSVRPYGVDVSSGVEIEKGIKDRVLIQDFVNAVREGDRIYEID